ncbi:MAG TPA: GAF domain-containing protein [Chryseosolibacter sp.]
MKPLSFFGLKVLPNSTFKSLHAKMQALEREAEETLNYLGIIAENKSHVVPASTTESSEVVKRLSSFQEAMAKLIHETEQNRWHDAGISKFNELLNHHFSNPRVLFDQVVLLISQYVKANQVALFVAENVTDSNSRIVLEACYAYERKKYLEKVFNRDENLVGQAMLERSTILLTNVPQFYTKITSGLGEATPACILIVPLKDEAKCVGAIELAAFRKFNAREIRFMEQLAVSLAAAIQNIKQTETMRELIAMGEMAQHAMKEKDEEIRQQMEELQATNEQMNRKAHELEQMRAALERKNGEIEQIRAQEKQLLESKLETQKNSYELIINRLKYKLQENKPS